MALYAQCTVRDLAMYIQVLMGRCAQTRRQTLAAPNPQAHRAHHLQSLAVWTACDAVIMRGRTKEYQLFLRRSMWLTSDPSASPASNRAQPGLAWAAQEAARNTCSQPTVTGTAAAVSASVVLILILVGMRHPRMQGSRRVAAAYTRRACLFPLVADTPPWGALAPLVGGRRHSRHRSGRRAGGRTGVR